MATGLPAGRKDCAIEPPGSELGPFPPGVGAEALLAGAPDPGPSAASQEPPVSLPSICAKASLPRVSLSGGRRGMAHPGLHKGGGGILRGAHCLHASFLEDLQQPPIARGWVEDSLLPCTFETPSCFLLPSLLPVNWARPGFEEGPSLSSGPPAPFPMPLYILV